MSKREKTEAILLLIVLIAIGGIVMYGKDQVPYKVKPPTYATPR